MAVPVRLDPERLIFALAAAAEARDAFNESHTQRVANTALQLGSRLGLQESDLAALYRGGLIHDIGKIGVPAAILLKPGPLNAEEERQMREHPVIGESIVKPLPSTADVLAIIRHHHERFDGGGYPDGRPAIRFRSSRGSCRSATRMTPWRTTVLTGRGATQRKRWRH